MNFQLISETIPVRRTKGCTVERQKYRTIYPRFFLPLLNKNIWFLHLTTILRRWIQWYTDFQYRSNGLTITVKYCSQSVCYSNVDFRTRSRLMTDRQQQRCKFEDSFIKNVIVKNQLNFCGTPAQKDQLFVCYNCCSVFTTRTSAATEY